MLMFFIKGAEATKLFCSSVNNFMIYLFGLGNFRDKVTTARENLQCCTQCQMSFRQPVDLKAHSRIHTGEKPFCCLSCEKSFGDSSTRRKHTRVHKRENSTAVLSEEDPLQIQTP
jgi:uncharacterized Zn-finger protein